jgi:hypothetical protein
MITYGTIIKHEGENWLVSEIEQVAYVNFIGYVVTVRAFRAVMPMIVAHFDLIANGTLLGYNKSK